MKLDLGSYPTPNILTLWVNDEKIKDWFFPTPKGDFIPVEIDNVCLHKGRNTITFTSQKSAQREPMDKRMLCIAIKNLIIKDTDGVYIHNFKPKITTSIAEKIPFEQEVLAYEQNNERGETLFIGSSSIRQWESLIRDFAPLSVFRRGFTGAYASDVLQLTNRMIISYRPRSIVLYVGDNDIAANKEPRQVLNDIRNIIENTYEVIPTITFYILSIKPSPARMRNWNQAQETNHLLQKYVIYATAAGIKVRFVDISSAMLKDNELRLDLFMSDGIHMNQQGYALWTSILKPILFKDRD
jgi:lysophospholipase L1-like esterase